MDNFSLGLAAWIIQDGNYPDLAIGQQVRTAPCFWSETYTLSKSEAAAFAKLRPATYQVCGQVVFASEDVWVIDCGFLAYCDGPPPQIAKLGAWISSEIYLGFDPFDYAEVHQFLPGIPSLTQTYAIDQILLETTPWIREEKLIYRDKRVESYTEVAKTDAWNDDNGSGHYVLECIPVTADKMTSVVGVD